MPLLQKNLFCIGNICEKHQHCIKIHQEFQEFSWKTETKNWIYLKSKKIFIFFFISKVFCFSTVKLLCFQNAKKLYSLERINKKVTFTHNFNIFMKKVLRILWRCRKYFRKFPQYLTLTGIIISHKYQDVLSPIL